MNLPHRFKVTPIPPCLLRQIAVATACLWALSARHACADVFIENDRLTVTTANITAVFRGPDLVRLYNKTTQELYVNSTSAYSMMDMGMLTSTDKPLRWLYWHKGKGINANPDAAQIMLNDLTRTVWMNVIVDPETQDITITLWGDSHKYGVTGLTWGIRGLDLGAGRMIIPANGGRYADRTNCPQDLALAYPTEWEAQMAVWEGKQGGFVVYCRDDRAFSKTLRMKRKGDFADVGFETQAEAPFEKAGGVPQMEWRINTYKGDWRTPAAGYRNLMNFFRRPTDAKDARAWVFNTRTVTTVKGPKHDSKLLVALAKKTDPKKTLLYLTDWRQSGFDVNYPDYTARDGVRTFIDKAHELGFHVMLHASLGVSPTHEDFARVRRYQVKDATTQRPIGARWEGPDGDPKRFAYMNPAAKPYRDLVLTRLRDVIDDLQADAVHLQGSGLMYNDGNGTFENKNLAQGSMALHRAILTAFPNVVLSADGMNELLMPYTWFAQRTPSASALAPHPISAFLFSNHSIAYGGLGMPDPDRNPSAFQDAFRQFEQQGVIPSPVVASEADITDPKHNNARLWKLAKLWQEHGFGANWDGDWKSFLYCWMGTDGVPALLQKQGGGVVFKVGEDVVYRRQGGSTQIVSSLFMPGWTAYDEGNLYGLDPTKEYWLDSLPRPQTTHLSSLGQGLILTGAQVTPAYGLFQVAQARKASGDSGTATATLALPGDAGAVSYGGSAEPSNMGAGALTYSDLKLPANLVVFTKPGLAALAATNLLEKPHENVTAEAGFATSSAAVDAATLMATDVGGVNKQALKLEVAPGSQSILSWVLKLPDAEKVSLSLAVGVGQDGSPIRYTVRVNGEKVWSTDAKEAKWHEGSVDLTRWKGKTVLLELMAESTNGEATTTQWAEVILK